ncbi:Mannan endo-1,6-alpha-mannosidase DCW1 [Colletotrichum siamense]|uniref:Mannan endo-1,6-alpha-mannosidase n=1 Tax=Colletotrichum siamense TaxID=690259 RepID=A0A9P5EYI4_COLSI|nr:Mannan endo-1,6-alpha-mannosidase DCW1 [Colletotrichum tropicale]KAF4857118.1 Mannan endo-1,6-alpha-mannosidase DCW1 [Colletotrichum siamense]KAF4862059.1 Mannan endo-1,6-alpha-mannosidase DCW1 [Colletotrichum siamense]
MRPITLSTLTAGLGLATAVNAIDVTFTDNESIKSAAGTIAYGLVKYYTGNNTGDTPGNLPDPYYWWEAGAMFGTLVDYWWLTGDDSYNTITTQALLHQVGDDNDYMPQNQTLTEGNDDQGFWAMAAMSAAEHKYPNPPDGEPQWLALVQAVFNEYVSRWDTGNCGGGVRWQIFTWNAGYDYKNSISNGCFFNVAARLARYTGNTTYSDWAEKVWDWETSVGLITSNHEILDGVHFEGSCPSSTDSTKWSYNAGIFLYGAAVMYNITESDTWKTRVDEMLTDITTAFVQNNILYEAYCEPTAQCSQDAQSFKGYLSRWMAATMQVASYTTDTIQPLLLSSAQAAATACSGSPASGFKGHAGTACGFSWLNNTFDGLVGVGPQMNSLQIIMYNLVSSADAPVTANTGGNSSGDVTGGKSDGSGTKAPSAITTADKAGAAILTILVTGSVVAGTVFMVL